MKSTGHLTLIDLLAVVGATGLGLAWVKWVAPPDRSDAALIVLGPVVGILWHRLRGGRGILGGTLGGAAYAGIFLLYFFMGPQGSKLAGWTFKMKAMFIILISLSCAFTGTVLGVAAWLMAAAMGRPRAPKPSVMTSAVQADPDSN
ncbi:hypothetical protein V5E97_10620 [Singulisphaera sp. Ch08]|uniref:DUF3054 domain-containing protein n=1 Tax=Singulisphaera sp. Ch08 TaxID=3120278 RepID=A0AAU7CN83_9BACT